MKLIYDNNTGIILQVIYDKDVFLTEQLTGIAAFTDYTIDEIDPINKQLCLDLARKVGKVDSQGNGKYYFLNGELYERENWVAHYPEMEMMLHGR